MGGIISKISKGALEGEDAPSGIVICISEISSSVDSARLAFLIIINLRIVVLTQILLSGSPHHPSGQKATHFLLPKGRPNDPFAHRATHSLVVSPKRLPGQVVTQVRVVLSLKKLRPEQLKTQIFWPEELSLKGKATSVQLLTQSLLAGSPQVPLGQRGIQFPWKPKVQKVEL